MADVVQYTGGRYVAGKIGVIRECLLEVIFNGEPLATIACLGLHPDELAVGFLRSEGLLSDREDLQEVDVSADGLTVHVKTAKAPPPRPGRGFMVASSGARSRSDESPVFASAATGSICFEPGTIFRLMAEMVDQARHHQTTRGTHCAALADKKELLALREDIGRHNCLDMLVGHCFLNGIDTSDKLLLRTGRVSSEIVRKVSYLGVRQVASLSVPTAAAMELAEKTGIMLLGAVRNNGMIIYTQKTQIGDL